MPIPAEQIARIRISQRYGFKYIETKGLIHDHSSWWTFDDEQVVRDRHWHIKPGEIVLDVGAAFGSYALPALAMGASVIAFNPSDFDSELLAANVALNGVYEERFIQFRDGIGETDGWFCPRTSAFADSPPAGAKLGGGGVTAEPDEWIRVRSLDSWMKDHPPVTRVDWLKFDIEGAELAALRGGVETIRKFKPKLLIENHQFHHPTMERDVIAFLTGLGLGYVCDGPYPYHSVSHSYFEAK